MEPVLGAEAGDTGHGEGTGSWEDIGGSSLGLCCASRTSHQENTFSKAKKSLFALGGGFWLFPGSQVGACLRRSV